MMPAIDKPPGEKQGLLSYHTTTRTVLCCCALYFQTTTVVLLLLQCEAVEMYNYYCRSIVQ